MAVRKKREHGDHAQAVEPGALMLAMLFLRLLSQNSMCPAMLPKPPSTRKRPCGAQLMVLRCASPKLNWGSARALKSVRNSADALSATVSTASDSKCLVLLTSDSKAVTSLCSPSSSCVASSGSVRLRPPLPCGFFLFLKVPRKALAARWVWRSPQADVVPLQGGQTSELRVRR